VVVFLKGNLEPTELHDEVLSSLSEIFDGMEKLVNYFIGYKRSSARWDGVLAGVLVIFVGVYGIFVVNLLTNMSVTEYFIEHSGSNLVYLGSLAAAAFLIGLITSSTRKASLTRDYILWKNSLDGLKKAATQTNTDGTNIIERTLQLMHQAAAWQPGLLKIKSDEASVYGITAFLLSAFLAASSPIGMPIALLIGVTVWLYFRTEKRKEAEQQIRKFEDWKQNLEEGEESFLKSV
jgi:hypothetical protein